MVGSPKHLALYDMFLQSCMIMMYDVCKDVCESVTQIEIGTVHKIVIFSLCESHSETHLYGRTGEPSLYAMALKHVINLVELAWPFPGLNHFLQLGLSS